VCSSDLNVRRHRVKTAGSVWLKRM